LANAGASAFACDPNISAPKARVIWRPEILLYSVMLVPAPRRFSHAHRLDRTGVFSRVAPSIGSSRYAVLPESGGNHYLWLRHVRDDTPLAALVPLDDDGLQRMAGLLRFLRRLSGRSPGPLPGALALTARSRTRLVLMVQALDGHLARASYREIALALHGVEAVARYPWKTSSVRGQTIRLVKDAGDLMQGGYRRLLQGGRL
jgi:hypothetical protein